MKLWFENCYGEERVIAYCDTWTEVQNAIGDFVEQCNRTWTTKKPFEIFYFRIWRQEDGRTRIDVGSHSEFFIWEGEAKYD